jgi:hypothetical protein
MAIDSDNNAATAHSVSGYHSIAPGDVDTPAKRTTLVNNLQAELEAVIDAEQGVSGTDVVVTCNVAGSYLVLNVTYELPSGVTQYADLPRTQVQFDAPGVGDGFQYRGQVVTVLPGQSNVIRLYLSSLFTQ